MNDPLRFDTGQFQLRFGANSTLAFGDASSWLAEAASALFAVYVDGTAVTAQTTGVQLASVETEDVNGRHVAHMHYTDQAHGLEVTHHVATYPGNALFETWQTSA